MIAYRPTSAALFLLPSIALLGCGDSGTTAGSTGGPDVTCAPADGCPTAKTDCVGLVDNSTAANYALRISHLTVSKPAVLADVTVKTLLDQGISPDLPKCMADAGYPLFPAPTSTEDLLGTFSWILQFDTATNKLTTGGAKPVADPTGGYCFDVETIQGFNIKPLVVDAPVGSDGSFEITMPQDVVVPVFSDHEATNVILLPLKSVRIHDAKLSSDHNCIGTFNTALDPNNNCLASDDQPTFIDAATLDGYMNLEDADKVAVAQLANKSLCAILAGETGPLCKRDGSNKIVFQGDYCSSPEGPATAGCADSVQLSANFAASSVAMKASCP